MDQYWLFKFYNIEYNVYKNTQLYTIIFSMLSEKKGLFVIGGYQVNTRVHCLH